MQPVEHRPELVEVLQPRDVLVTDLLATPATHGGILSKWRSKPTFYGMRKSRAEQDWVGSLCSDVGKEQRLADSSRLNPRRARGGHLRIGGSAERWPKNSP